MTLDVQQYAIHPHTYTHTPTASIKRSQKVWASSPPPGPSGSLFASHVSISLRLCLRLCLCPTERENGRRRHCQSVQPIKIGSAVFEYMQGWKHVCLHFYDRKREGSWNSIRPALNPRNEKFAGKIIYKQYLNT